MTTFELIDPELRDALLQRPKLRLDIDVLDRSRTFVIDAAASSPPFEAPHVSVDEIFVPSEFGASAIRVKVYRSLLAEAPLPTIIHLHGGGFVLGLPEMKDRENCFLADNLRCAIYSIDYRLAPESPYPAQLHDMYSVLNWLDANADSLKLNPKRRGIKGESGGGGLAACLTLYVRDQMGPPLSFQHLTFPMLDDRTATRMDLSPFVGEFVWTQKHNLFGWQSLLGGPVGGAEVSPYAAAARATDLSGLPPTFICVGALDLFLEENLDFARRLSRAGVPVEFHLYPGAYHGFHVAGQARVTKQAQDDSFSALRRFLHG